MSRTLPVQQGHSPGQQLAPALDALEMPARGLYGLGRGAYGVITGESDPLAQAARVASQTQEQSAQQFGDYVYDNTESPAAATIGYTAANFFGPI